MQLQVVGKMPVGLPDVWLEIFELQADHRPHERRISFATSDRVVHETRLQDKNRKGLLLAQAGEEQPATLDLCAVHKIRLVVRRCRHAERGENALRIASRASHTRAELSRRQPRDAGRNEELDEQGDADEGK